MKEEPMKILFVTAYFPPALGGVENYVFNVALGLKQTPGTDIVVVTSSLNEKKQRIEIYAGIKVYRLPVMMRISNTPINPLWYFSLKRIIREEKPDIINSHQPVMFLGDIAACLAGKIPFVLTYHSGTMKKNQLPIDIIITLYEKFVLPHTAKKATRIICASNFVRDTFLNDYATKIAVISPGVNISLYKPDSDVKKEEKLVLFVAAYKKMFKIKGLYYLIDALKLLPEAKLRIVGENIDFSDKSIISAGIKRGSDLVEEMQKASVVMLPSIAHMEAFPTVLIEAMACGTPVIGTNRGGIPEIIRDGVDGFIVPVNDRDALALAISKILVGKELATRMGRAGAARVRDTLNWDTRVALTKEVFAACLK
jgi:glycosyltransferase involved in cell wall biosynthesis